ncbi:hypothetical protein [Clostridium sp. AWRP]|nr:hypothetical protein [Clostridium sp. AWRP]
MIKQKRTTQKNPKEKTDKEKIDDLQAQVFHLTTQLMEKGAI